MKQDFLKLIQILLGEEPGQQIADNQQAFHALSQNFNDVLKLRSEKTRLHTELSYEGNDYLIPPVPFASTNEHNQPLAFAFLGLNPKLSLVNEDTILEKRYAGKTWEDYAHFYTSINRNEHDIGRFYRFLTILMESLKNKQLVKYPEIMKGCKNKHEKLERFNQIAENDPLLVGELIPLHSSEMGALDKQNLLKLFREVDSYHKYLTTLFHVINGKLDSNGWLIGNGKGASAALEMFIENQTFKGNFQKVLDKREEKYTCYVWENEGASRKVLLLHEFLGIQGGKLNSYKQIGDMVSNVINVFAK